MDEKQIAGLHKILNTNGLISQGGLTQNNKFICNNNNPNNGLNNNYYTRTIDITNT